ncbi:MAG: hypothetical protein V1685_07600 [Parcubacteria group bacterium]
MGISHIKDGADKEVTLDRVAELFYFLSEGKTPEGMEVKYPPRLGARKAMAVIWFLQEHMDLIPDKFEMCVGCKEMYDSYSEGHYDEKTGRCHCDACRR